MKFILPLIAILAVASAFDCNGPRGKSGYDCECECVNPGNTPRARRTCSKSGVPDEVDYLPFPDRCDSSSSSSDSSSSSSSYGCSSDETWDSSSHSCTKKSSSSSSSSSKSSKCKKWKKKCKRCKKKNRNSYVSVHIFSSSVFPYMNFLISQYFLRQRILMHLNSTL